MASSSVSAVNVNVVAFQPSYDALGLGPVPANTTIDSAVKSIQSGLVTFMKSQWPESKFPAYDSTQVNTGIMQPYDSNIGGTAPVCAIEHISKSFDGWQIPYSPDVTKTMASEIADNISNDGGIKGSFNGKTNLNANETIYWAVAYTTSVVIDPNVQGIIFAFTATLQD